MEQFPIPTIVSVCNYYGPKYQLYRKAREMCRTQKPSQYYENVYLHKLHQKNRKEQLKFETKSCKVMVTAMLSCCGIIGEGKSLDYILFLKEKGVDCAGTANELMWQCFTQIEPFYRQLEQLDQILFLFNFQNKFYNKMH